MSDETMTCEAVRPELDDWIDGDLPPARRAAVERHLVRCAGCDAAAAELRRLVDAARALPPLEPPRDLWTGIAHRLEAPVVPLAATAPMRWPWRRHLGLGAAAAALVVMTAGATYLATARAGRDSPVARSAPALAASDASAGAAPVVAESARVQPAPAVDAARRSVTATTASTERRPARRGAGGAKQAGAPGAAVEGADALQHIERAYGAEIARLRALVGERRAELDPGTVAVIEQTLRIIDIAIEQSRAALARDPASPLLTDHFRRALDTKLELLRTTTMLPARS